jgi:hypothetical protein
MARWFYRGAGDGAGHERRPGSCGAAGVAVAHETIIYTYDSRDRLVRAGRTGPVNNGVTRLVRPRPDPSGRQWGHYGNGR